MRFVAILALVLAALSAPAEGPSGTPALETRLRRPVALVTQGEMLLAGNRRSGSITVIEPASGTIVAEHPVAERIADMAGCDDEGGLLVLDDAGGSLRRVVILGDKASARSIASVPRSASKLALSRKRRQVFVTARWSREVVSITLGADFARAVRQETIDLAFAPRDLLLVNGERHLLVADAFGGRLAVIDALRSRVLAVHELDGHNVRGLAAGDDGKRLYVAHQHFPDGALADYEELHWGRMVTNGVRVLDLERVLHPGEGQRLGGWVEEHGGIGGAMGDPGGLVTGPRRILAAAFSGVGEVLVRTEDYVRRIRVGAHPEAMAIRGRRLYVANRFDDSVSVIDLDRREVVRTISLGPSPELTAVDRGEKLFFDARVSHDGWMSCHSCHTDGHSAGLLVDTLGDGDYGAPKRIPSLLGTRDTNPWGWTGGAESLTEQVLSSVTTTMHGALPEGARASDLVAYLESLEPPPPLEDPGREEVRRGRALFESEGCADCHAPPAFTSDRTFDVGFADERGRRSFNPPSLRGVGQRDRLFHDGRAKSLADVLVRFRHRLDEPLSKEEVEALSAYLRSL